MATNEDPNSPFFFSFWGNPGCLLLDSSNCEHSHLCRWIRISEITTFSCPPQQSWSHYFGGETQDIRHNNYNNRNSLVAHTVKNSSPLQETQVLSLGREDLLEEGMTTHSSILAWRILWTEEPDRLREPRPRAQWGLSGVSLKVPEMTVNAETPPEVASKWPLTNVRDVQKSDLQREEPCPTSGFHGSASWPQERAGGNRLCPAARRPPRLCRVESPTGWAVSRLRTETQAGPHPAPRAFLGVN